MSTKKGRILHSKGGELHNKSEAERSAFLQVLAGALKEEVHTQRAPVKLVMRWTDASERTVKAWLSGASVPSGEHLIRLMRSSETIFEAVLRLSGRMFIEPAKHLEDAERHLVAATNAIRKARGPIG
jgi:hypothetical protein